MKILIFSFSLYINEIKLFVFLKVYILFPLTIGDLSDHLSKFLFPLESKNSLALNISNSLIQYH